MTTSWRPSCRWNSRTFRIVEDHIHEGLRGRYFVLHGDVFDTVTQNFAFLSHFGDWGYQVLLKINRAYNAWRAWRGKEYWSLSKAIKARVKSAVNHVSKFEDHIAQLAHDHQCVGVMCGHIHTPADKMIGEIHYLNSGDWIESLTAIVEHYDGRFELLDYVSFLRDFPMPAEEPAMESSPSRSNARPDDRRTRIPRCGGVLETRSCRGRCAITAMGLAVRPPPLIRLCPPGDITAGRPPDSSSLPRCDARPCRG